MFSLVSPSKRNSTTSSSKDSSSSSSSPPLNHHPTALLSDRAHLTGTHPITLRANCVVHPFSRIDSTLGPVEIGEGALVWESARVGGASSSASPSAASKPEATQLARYAIVEAMATVAAGATVGEHTSVEVGASVGRGAEIGKHCRIAPKCVVADGEEVPDYTVLFFSGDLVEDGEEEFVQYSRANETVRAEAKVRDMVEQGREKHVDALRRLVKGKTGSSS